MPSDAVDNGALVPFSGESSESPPVHPLHHGLVSRISRLAISWSRGNSLRVSLFAEPSEIADARAGAKVVEIDLSGRDSEIDNAHWRRIAYGSVAPFALLQSRRSSVSVLSKAPSSYYLDWWEHVLEYSKEITSLLGVPKLPPSPIIEVKKKKNNYQEPVSFKVWLHHGNSKARGNKPLTNGPTSRLRVLGNSSSWFPALHFGFRNCSDDSFIFCAFDGWK